MRISDYTLSEWIKRMQASLRRSNEGNLAATELLCLDLQDARAEIARLKKQIDALERTSK